MISCICSSKNTFDIRIRRFVVFILDSHVWATHKSIYVHVTFSSTFNFVKKIKSIVVTISDWCGLTIITPQLGHNWFMSFNGVLPRITYDKVILIVSCQIQAISTIKKWSRIILSPQIVCIFLKREITNWRNQNALTKRNTYTEWEKKIMFSLGIAVIFRFAPNSFYKFKYWIQDIQIDSSINHWLNQYAQEIIWIIT